MEVWREKGFSLQDLRGPTDVGVARRILAPGSHIRCAGMRGAGEDAHPTQTSYAVAVLLSTSTSA